MGTLLLLAVGASLLWWVIKAIARPEMERRAAIEANARLAAEIAAFAAAHKKCPRCAELVKAEALACRYCGNEFPAPSPGIIVDNTLPPRNGRYLVRCTGCGRDWMRGTGKCPNCDGKLHEIIPSAA